MELLDRMRKSRLGIKFVTRGTVLEESEQALHQLPTQHDFFFEYFNAKLRKKTLSNR
jgi:hypothetical protein